MENISAFLSDAANNLDLTHAVMLIGSAVLSFTTAYNNTAKKMKGSLTELIGQAEKEYSQWQGSGTLKHDWVVEKLSEMLPAPLRPFFSDTKIKEMVNNAFGGIQEFISLQNIVEVPPEQSHESGQSAAVYTEVIRPEPNFDAYGVNAGEYTQDNPSYVRIEYRRPNEFTITVLPE